MQLHHCVIAWPRLGQTTVIKNVNQSPEVLDFILVENDHFWGGFQCKRPPNRRVVKKQSHANLKSGMSIWSEMRENEWNCKVSKEIKMNEVSTILTDLTQLKPWNFHYFQWISLRSDSQTFAWDYFLTTRRLCTENLRGIFCSGCPPNWTVTFEGLFGR